MIHPCTRLQYINDQIGYGVFATSLIPMGSITYVKDSLELEIKPQDFHSYSQELQDTIEKYSYIDADGVRIVSWDFAKYVNHCCNCNTMSTGYGFEIALRDILPGEEITDEYGLFNMTNAMELSCKYQDCRKKVSAQDIESLYIQWDAQLLPALLKIGQIEQPLLPLVDADTKNQIFAFLDGHTTYKSVKHLQQKAALNNLSFNHNSKVMGTKI
ncbi:MAG: hypothetical protein DHS20C18_49500 [Saprospiraceae bacterium]|nr:MAG: hypothetical protein DHS20C18_49500 [Saprospiraceae bacterium]